MKTRLNAIPLLTFAASMLSACGGSKAATGKTFDVLLNATSDDGDPLGGVKFTTGAAPIGTSNAKGILATNIRGVDGQTLPVSTICPDGFVSPEQSSSLKLTEVRRVNQTGVAPLSLEVVCTRKLREIVLVVRTANAPSLSVDVGGRTVGKTDSGGNAHVHLQLDREVRSLSVSLATNDSPELRPQNPSRVYDLNGQDALLLFEQSFTAEPKSIGKRRLAKSTSPGKHVPYRIDSGRYHGL